MALVIGDDTAAEGMAGDIYVQLERALSPPMQKAVDEAADEAKATAERSLVAAREGWKKLAFAIAHGVITHLLANMEVVGIDVSGSITATVTGESAVAAPGAHKHGIELTAIQPMATFHQNPNHSGTIR
ncbi:MAG: hypothetical protein EOP16_00540 [Pseudonocardia sp.]|nr:MAG: hypothetical protein EOP16_00540 [Pseudonocardia sp.]